MKGRRKLGFVPSGPEIRRLLEPHMEAIVGLIIQIRNEALTSVPLKRRNLRRAVKPSKKV